MSETYDSFFLVEQVRQKRVQAMRCRAILKDIDQATAGTFLTEYAMQLEKKAELLENILRRTTEGAQALAREYDSTANR